MLWGSGMGQLPPLSPLSHHLSHHLSHPSDTSLTSLSPPLSPPLSPLSPPLTCSHLLSHPLSRLTTPHSAAAATAAATAATRAARVCCGSGSSGCRRSPSRLPCSRSARYALLYTPAPTPTPTPKLPLRSLGALRVLSSQYCSAHTLLLTPPHRSAMPRRSVLLPPAQPLIPPTPPTPPTPLLTAC